MEASPSQVSASPARAIALLAVAAFASQSMVRVSDSLLPQIATDLGVGIGAASFIVSGYGLAHGSVQLVIGPVGDRFGKFLCVAIACAISTILVTLCGLAQTLPALVTARLASGLSAGCIIPLAMAYVGDVIPYEQRQAVLGRFLSGLIAGQLFGQAAGGILGDLMGWRNVFFLLAGLFAVATIALVAELVRNPSVRATGEPKARSAGFVADYSAVLGGAWARIVILSVFIEAALLFGSLAYIGADMHLRFGLGFTLVGIVVGMFAVGGLLYSLSVRILVDRLGQIGLTRGGGIVLAIAFLVLAIEPNWRFAPAAVCAIGFGFYMLHNTLQVNATQMTPQARGTAVAIFSAALYLGQTAGVAAGALAIDRFTAVPLFFASALGLPMLAFWFARRLVRQRAGPQ